MMTLQGGLEILAKTWPDSPIKIKTTKNNRNAYKISISKKKGRGACIFNKSTLVFSDFTENWLNLFFQVFEDSENSAMDKADQMDLEEFEVIMAEEENLKDIRDETLDKDQYNGDCSGYPVENTSLVNISS